MNGLRQGSFRLFRFSGIDVFLHWSWFLIAAYEINARKSSYSSVGWNVAEYLALFLIVTLHEFGHALACRQVGGISDHIVLWPLGGVAYVNPPPRPGATLWSLAAGPLVNAALIPVLWAAGMMSRSMGWAHTAPDAIALLHSIWWINLGLLIFNMLPIYPLDGGQILRSLLWFVMGRGRSLMVATIFGFVGFVAFIAFAVWAHSVWFGILAVFILMNSWNGLKQAQALLRLGRLPRHVGFACPTCKAAPPAGNLWLCGKCGNQFDTFQTHARCPHCAVQFDKTRCLDCGRMHPMSEWIATVPLHPAG
ncbi:MAG: site-2 protease family protein [Candidatus Acidiferrales bacterium]